MGIVGMGRIGSIVAEKCRLGLGMKIIAYDPYAAEKYQGTDCIFSPSLEALFKEADFISLHCPDIPETKGMVNRGLIFSMKESAFLINCARGGVVDEEVLADALDQKKIAGAALDVFSNEPPSPDGRLLKLNNVILSPHSAALSQEASVRMAAEAAQALLDFFSGKEPRDIFNRKELQK
jgi:D-3-phosphoglycerate dehydrogenase